MILKERVCEIKWDVNRSLRWGYFVRRMIGKELNLLVGIYKLIYCNLEKNLLKLFNILWKIIDK